MGSCCCSCKDENVSEQEEECAQLLEPPGEEDGDATDDSVDGQGEEAILKSILAKTASSIIDVAAAQSQRLGPNECMDRARLYRNRLAKLNHPVVSGRGGARGGTSCGSGTSRGGLRSYWKKKEPPPERLPSLTNYPHRVLADAQVPYADVQEAIHIAEDAHRAMQHVRVQPQEELVVHFEVV